MYNFNLFVKRLFDFISSSLLALLLAPLWIVIAIMIKLDSNGPVIFKQGRRTLYGREFQMYKFRSMVINAEQIGTGLFNYEDDPRVTRVGRFLRNSSLDELPQLFNIIKGDMSVIGPRPCVTYELGDFDTLNKRYKKRFEMKAGLTGLAQVKGRNDNSWDDKVTLDNQYIDSFKKYGVLIDLKILLDSIIKVLKKDDIYEFKKDSSMTDLEAARLEEEEIIRIAHLPDEE